VGHKKGRIINLYMMLPPAAFLDGLFHSVRIYKLTNRKTAFLLPLQHVFKNTAWCIGYIRSILDFYRSTNLGKHKRR
jgi:hypothetical protein